MSKDTTHPTSRADTSASAPASPNPRQRERLVQLQAMLDDRDWAPAYEDCRDLRQALVDLVEAAHHGEPRLEEETLRVLVLEAEDYQDFCAFREEWIREGDAVPGTGPREWLRARLRAWDEAERENQSRAECFKESFWACNERFRVV